MFLSIPKQNIRNLNYFPLISETICSIENFGKDVKLESVCSFAVNEAEIFCVRLDQDDNYLAAGNFYSLWS